MNQRLKSTMEKTLVSCKRWTEIGGKCHILVDDYITHVGEYRYTGRLMDDLDFKKD
jgi:hypothetical protein